VTRGTKAVIVCPLLPGRTSIEPDQRLEEAVGLAAAIGITVAHAYAVPVRQPRAGTLFGEGQVNAIATACEQYEAELVIVDGVLSAIQQRNLEDRLARKVIDRTGLILEIFGERAATAEGRLQVELAHLDYQAGRLVRSWTHLERQRGGYGFLGGPGETQIEADRRMIRDRMARLRRDLEQVRRTRALHRERRGRVPWPLIALVGYTNAGKSTLFNRLTGSDVMAEDLLFATLDPTMRSVRLPGIDKAILSDTVGFISDLPTQLVAAFRATLEEVTAADLIVHVRDIASPESETQKRQVLKILGELGLSANEDEGEGGRGVTTIIEVWNKWDRLAPDRANELRCMAATRPDKTIIPVSAVTGEGCDDLLIAIGKILTGNASLHTFLIPASDGHRQAWLHAHGEVIGEMPEKDSDGQPMLRIKVRLTPRELGRFNRL